MAQIPNAQDIIMVLNALAEELGSRDDIHIDDAAMTLVHSIIDVIVTSLEQAFPVGTASEQQLHLLQTILVHEWDVRPSDDDLDSYWFLRGVVRRFCQEHNVDEEQLLPRIVQFIHIVVIGDEDEATQ